MQLKEIIAQPKLLSLAVEDSFVVELACLVDRHQRTMDMRVQFVQMNNESNDVLFPIFLGHELIHVLCPVLDVRFPCHLRVVSIRPFLNGLIAESQTSHLFARTAKDHIDHSAILPFLQALVRVFDATTDEISPHSCRNTMLFVNSLDYTALSNLKIKVVTSRIIVTSTVCFLQRLLSTLTKMLCTLSLTHAFLSLNV